MSATPSSSGLALLRSVPAIRRARFWHLYSVSGKRFLDFWMEGGKAITGHRDLRVGKAIKDCVDTGLDSRYPSAWGRRLTKAILLSYPEYSRVKLFSSEQGALDTLKKYLGVDAAMLGGGLVVKRPFGEFLEPERQKSGPAREENKASCCAALVFPCPAALSPGALIFKDASGAPDIEEDSIPPLLLAAAARSLYSFDSFRRVYDERHWSKIDAYVGGVFRRSGPWLYPEYSRDSHGKIFKACLENGVVISPEFDQPSLVPGMFDDGEVKFFASRDFRSVLQPGADTF